MKRRTVNRTLVDWAVGVVLASILLFGSYATWVAYRQWIAIGDMGDHMGLSVGAMHGGTHPVWYAAVTLALLAIVGGGYLFIRDRMELDEGSSNFEIFGGDKPASDGPNTSDVINANGGGAPVRENFGPNPLDLLPDDERTILEPIIDSPGITQIEVRDRSGFSKSKISQKMADFERRGLIYREPQGRTYRVYPTEKLKSV